MSDDNTYFVMVATTSLPNGTPHSFLALGKKDKAGNISIPLEIGKQLTSYPRSCFGLVGMVLAQLVYHLDARLEREHFFQHKLIQDRGTFEKKLSYIAYEIRLEQYNQFLGSLDNIIPQPERKSAERDEEMVMPVQNPDKFFTQAKSHAGSLSVTNTCRDSAVDLINLARGTKTPTCVLPRWFLTRLPFETSIVRQDWTRPLVILPLPPNAVALDPRKKKVLTQLYQRLEKLAGRQGHSEIALKKFKVLKSIYESHITAKKMAFPDFLQSLLIWHEQNSTLIKTHRGFHFFWQSTATEKIFEEINKEHQQLSKPA